MVYAGTLDNWPVCLKTLHLMLPGILAAYGYEDFSPEHVAQLNALQKEALNLAARPNHANVVAFRGVVLDEHGCLQYIALELCDGGGFDTFLTRYIGAHGGVAPRVLMSWLVDSACGLAFLHSSGRHPVVHRDLKPENLLVRLLSDGSEVIVVGDLGESRALTTTHPLATTNGIGNAFTKAPEVTQDGRHGPHSDVFSWAITMFIVTVQGLTSVDGESLVADPMTVYWANRLGLVTAALRRLTALNDDRVVELLQQCSLREYRHRPLMAHALQVLLTARADMLRGSAGVTAAEWLVSARF